MLKSVYLEGRIFEEFSERICLQSICYASYLKKLHGGCFSEMKRVENYFILFVLGKVIFPVFLNVDFQVFMIHYLCISIYLLFEEFYVTSNLVVYFFCFKIVQN